MIQREILAKLQEWKDSEYRKPLILRGARQVGKTTVVNELGRSFDNYLYFNLEDENTRNVFEFNMPLTDKIRMLFATRQQVRRDGSTLLFIDEIQNSPKTISLLRYFYEEHPELHVIAAGSLLETAVDMKSSFPVGRVEYMALRPCSFREFISAVGKSHLFQIMEYPEFTVTIHSELMSLFNQYTIIGGMPEIVQRYADKGDLLAMDDIYETLLQAYRDDVEKYVFQNKLQDVVRFILEMGWRQAGSSITLGNFMDSQYKSVEVGDAFRLLEKAMLLELVYPTTSVMVPVMPQIRRSPKLIWLDTGLVNYAAGIRKEIIGAKDILDIWRGHIGEHIVAQELLALNYKVSQRRSFWARDRKESAAEVDFIYLLDSKVYPIEVKTGNNSSLRSLHSFMDDSPLDIAVRVWSGPFSVDEVYTIHKRKLFRLINLPFYLICNIEQILRNIEA